MKLYIAMVATNRLIPFHFLRWWWWWWLRRFMDNQSFLLMANIRAAKIAKEPAATIWSLYSCRYAWIRLLEISSHSRIRMRPAVQQRIAPIVEKMRACKRRKWKIVAVQCCIVVHRGSSDQTEIHENCDRKTESKIFGAFLQETRERIQY